MLGKIIGKETHKTVWGSGHTDFNGCVAEELLEDEPHFGFCTTSNSS